MTNQLDESSYFYGKGAAAKFKEKADSIHGEGNWKAGTKDSFGSHMFHNKAGERIGHFGIDGEGDHTYTVFHKASPVPKGVKEEVESIDEISAGTLQSVAKKRAEQSKEAGGIGINNPTRTKAMSLLRKSDNAKYRHTEHPDKVTRSASAATPLTDAQKAAAEKTKKDAVDDQNNRGYGKGRYMGDSVEQVEVEDQLDEAHKLNNKVVMTYPSLKGVKGTIGEIRHGAYKGAPKTYTIDYQHPKHSSQHTSSIQLSSSQFKAHKEGTLGEEVESIDELSKDTIRSYTDKVSVKAKNIIDKANDQGFGDEGNATYAKAYKHLMALQKANKRLTKEEVESIDELSIDTVKSYKEKVKANPAPSKTTSDILHKAIRRFAGKERAEDRIHSDEMKKMRARLGIKEETLEEGNFADSLKDRAKTLVKKLTAPVKDPILDQMKEIGDKVTKRADDQLTKKYSDEHKYHNKEAVVAREMEKSLRKTGDTKSADQMAARAKTHEDKIKPKLNEEVLDEDAAQKNMSNAMDNIEPGKRDAARKQYESARKAGQSHAASMTLMHDRFGKTNEEVLDESDTPDRMKGKQKPYVSSDGKGNYEVLGNTGQTKATFSRATHGKDAHVSAQRHLKSKYSEYMKEEVLDEATVPSHKVGDTVYATSPTNKALTMTGKVTKVGASLTTVKHKDGSEAHYPHRLVGSEYSDLHKDPAKKYKQFQREHLEQTGKLLTLSEVKYMVENANGGVGAIAQHAGVDGEAPQGTGKIKKMMGNKASVNAIVKIIANGAKSKTESK